MPCSFKLQGALLSYVFDTAGILFHFYFHLLLSVDPWHKALPVFYLSNEPQMALRNLSQLH